MQPVDFQTAHPLIQSFKEFVSDGGFPCVGAKSALSRGNMHFLVCRDIASGWDDMRIYSALYRFVGDYRADRSLFRSFVLLFEEMPTSGEEVFERNLWSRVQSLTDKDDWLGQDVDPRVSHDPDDPHFSLSFAGEAFFVVGLHPAASRPARRFRTPALVFNLHDQFEQLRNDGRYEKMRSAILSRDLTLAGSENPMLARHGTMSEARQYSGRAVGADWVCPYSGRGASRDAA